MGLLDTLSTKLATANTNPMFMAGMGLLGSRGNNGAQSALLGMQQAAQNNRYEQAAQLAQAKLKAQQDKAAREEQKRQGFANAGQIYLQNNPNAPAHIAPLLGSPDTAEVGFSMIGKPASPIKAADGYYYDPVTKTRVFPDVAKEPDGERRIADGPDGRKRYVDTGELVFPGVQPEPKDRKTVVVGDTLVDAVTGQPIYQAEEGVDAGDEQKLRKEFNADPRVEEFNKMQSSYKKIVGAQPSAAGDMSLVFSLMKLFDPGSVVRESEYANAENARGVPGTVRNLWNKVRDGERLTPEQRQDFKATAYRLFSGQSGIYNQVVDRYRGLGEQYGYSPDRIATPFTPKRGDIPEGAIQHLKENPHQRAQFDELFGPGSAALYLDTNE